MPRDKASEQKVTAKRAKTKAQKRYRKRTKLLYGLMFALFGAGVACIGITQAKTGSAVGVPSSSSHSQMSGQMSGQKANQKIGQMAIEQPTYQTYDLMQATVHVVHLPAETPLSVVTAEELTTVDAFADRENALAVINAGFFDPQNGKTTSHLIIDAQLAGEPAENERLVDNPNLQAYLPQIFNRSEFRVYQCEGIDRPRYEITAHSEAVPDGCAIASAVGAGPRLLPENTSTLEAFTDYEDGELVRDAIGSVQPNARSAIALKADGSILLIMVAQRPDAPGMTLLELTDFARSIDATEMLNLDGGSSSALHYDGQLHLGRLDANGNPVNRPVKSVLIVEQS